MHVSKAVCGGQRHRVPLELVIGCSKPSMNAVFPVDAGYAGPLREHYTCSTTEPSLQPLALC